MGESKKGFEVLKSDLLMKTIPFYKPTISNSEIKEVVDTLESGWLTTGPKTKLFEAEFASYVQQPHAVAVNSCTAALHLALEAVGLTSAHSVLVPTMTFAATAEVVRYFSAKPILVDCNLADFNIDIADAEWKLLDAMQRGENVRAIIPVHYAGQVADMRGIRTLAQTYGLKVVEDAAHCCPSYYRGSPDQSWKAVGAEADVSCFSFYANKNITTGEGGMACTANAEYADRMRIMSLHGISRDAWKRYSGEGTWYYEILEPGFKYNLTDIASSLGLQQLRKADQFHEKRTELANLYTEYLSEVDELVLPREQTNRVHSWHLYVVRVRQQNSFLDRGALIQKLKENGIGTSVHYMPLHMHPYYRQRYGYKPQDLPKAAALYREIISLPLYPSMSHEDVEYVCSTLKGLIAAEFQQHVCAVPALP